MSLSLAIGLGILACEALSLIGHASHNAKLNKLADRADALEKLLADKAAK